MSEETKRTLQISIRCKVGGVLEPGFSGIGFGKYFLSPLPSENRDGFNTEFLLNFMDEWKEGQIGSNPEKEGEIILSWLSLVLRQKIKSVSSRLNNVQIPNRNKELIIFESPIKFPEEIISLYPRFRSLSLDKLLERYLRACECYQESLLISTTNPTISFFLLVVCIECLSSKDQDFYQYLMSEMASKDSISKEELNKINRKFTEEYGLKKNFIKFIFENYDLWKSTFSEEEFKKLLSSIYDIRSSFTHKGENLEKYITLVDNTLKSKSVFTKINGKYIEFPGLNYLSNIVRTALINFLEKQTPSEQDNIPQLALNESLVNLKVEDSLSVNKGDPIFTSQFKHRK
ncbi:MAG: hypothetical protein AABY16_04520 [Nanoarchaeota archaeon]